MSISKGIRIQRNFQVEEYYEKKLKQIDRFFKLEGLDCVVLGVSGGVDSALVLKLYLDCMNRYGTIKKVVPVIAPISDEDSISPNSISDQLTAEAMALNLCEEFDVDYVHKNLYNSYKEMLLDDSDDWSDGQMASVLRTPLFYYVAAIEQFKGFKSIVSGTTNFCEGSYIGYYGKGSDGMNDLQPISDILKSEVFELAEYVGVPNYIINRDPKGDVMGDLTDEELMGVTYEQLEDYLLMLNYGYASRIDYSLEHNKTIRDLHRKNNHKYRVGIPAHILTLFENNINSNWKPYEP